MFPVILNRYARVSPTQEVPGAGAIPHVQKLTRHASSRTLPGKIEARAGQEMAYGTVKWFNDAKGFGFIEPDTRGPDVFAHYSSIAMDGFKTLKQGSRVSFEISDGPKGPLAQDIKADMAAEFPALPERADEDGSGSSTTTETVSPSSQHQPPEDSHVVDHDLTKT